jgi:hypothetical protein
MYHVRLHGLSFDANRKLKDRQTLFPQDPVLAVSASQTEANSGLTPMLTLMK